MKAKRICVVLWVVLAITMLLPGCFKKDGDKKKESGQQASADPVSVVVEKIQEKTVPVYGEYVATIDSSTAAESVEIRARVEAFLQEQHYEEGQKVNKDQLLFTLDDRKYRADLMSAEASRDKALADLKQAMDKTTIEKSQAELESAKAQLEYAVVNSKRLAPLVEKKAVPQQDYDTAVTNERVARASVQQSTAALNNTILNQQVSIKQANASLESAYASIDNAKLNLSYCTITSPVEGVAGKRMVAPGNLVGNGQSTLLTTVTSLDPLRVSFKVSENDYLKIIEKASKDKESHGENPSLDLYLADGSKYPIKGSIMVIEPTLDPGSATINVVSSFANPDHILRPGMFGRIKFIIDHQKNALVCPKKAIITLQSAQNVYIVNDQNKVELRTITVDYDMGDSFIVKTGLKAGDQVIVEGQLKVRPGAEVKLMEKDKSKKPAGKDKSKEPAGK